MVKILTFDLDGTIVDSMNQLAVFAADLMYEYYGLAPEMGTKLYLFTSGVPFCEQLELIFPGKRENEDIYRKFESLKEENALDYPLYPEVKAVLRELSQQGYKLAISSSNAQHILEDYLAHFDLKLDLICGYRGPDFGKGKLHFNYIKDHFRVKAEEIIFIGDSLQDFAKAKESSVKFIARASTFSEEELKRNEVELVINDLRELFAILEELAH